MPSDGADNTYLKPSDGKNVGYWEILAIHL